MCKGPEAGGWASVLTMVRDHWFKQKFKGTLWVNRSAVTDDFLIKE